MQFAFAPPAAISGVYRKQCKEPGEIASNNKEGLFQGFSVPLGVTTHLKLVSKLVSRGRAKESSQRQNIVQHFISSVGYVIKVKAVFCGLCLVYMLVEGNPELDLVASVEQKKK